MGGLGYPYDVLRDGDAQVFDPEKETSCPQRPKALLRTRAQVDAVLKDLFARFRTDVTFSANIRVILGRTVAGQRTCAYHLARAMASAVVEAVGGTSGDEYDEFLVPLCGAVESIVEPGPPDVWRADVWTSLSYFLDAAKTGGLRKFMFVYRETEKAVRDA